MKSVCSGTLLVMLAALVLALTGVFSPPAGGADGEKETAVALASLRPERGGFHSGPVVIGGEKHDNGLTFGSSSEIVRYDTGEGYDLLEGFVGLMEDYFGNAGVLTVVGDGRMLAQFALNKRDRVRFISCPLGRCRLLDLRAAETNWGSPWSRSC